MGERKANGADDYMLPLVCFIAVKCQFWEFWAADSSLGLTKKFDVFGFSRCKKQHQQDRSGLFIPARSQAKMRSQSQSLCSVMMKRFWNRMCRSQQCASKLKEGGWRCVKDRLLLHRSDPNWLLRDFPLFPGQNQQKNCRCMFCFQQSWLVDTVPFMCMGLWTTNPYICIHTFKHTYLHTYLHTYKHKYIPQYIHTCMHTNIDAYINTCIQTYIHACIQLHPYWVFWYVWKIE